MPVKVKDRGKGLPVGSFCRAAGEEEAPRAPFSRAVPLWWPGWGMLCWQTLGFCFHGSRGGRGAAVAPGWCKPSPAADPRRSSEVGAGQGKVRSRGSEERSDTALPQELVNVHGEHVILRAHGPAPRREPLLVLPTFNSSSSTFSSKFIGIIRCWFPI